MLTDAEFEKLKKTDPRDKSNDFIVRRKFQKWLAGLCYVSVIILHYLPEKQIKKIIKQEHILHLCNILLHLFSIMSVPMVQKSAHEYIAVVPYYPPRPATKEEILMMDTFIKPLIYGLFRSWVHVGNKSRKRREAISTHTKIFLSPFNAITNIYHAT